MSGRLGAPRFGRSPMISESLAPVLCAGIAMSWPSSTAIKESLTANCLERIDAAREWLRSTLDPKPGDVIALALDNSWQFVACFFAVSELGCVLMPCNPQWRAAELRAFARRLGFRGAVIEPRLSAEWNQILDVIPNARCSSLWIRMPARNETAASVPLQPIPVEPKTLRRSICRPPGPPACRAWSSAAIAI